MCLIYDLVTYVVFLELLVQPFNALNLFSANDSLKEKA